MVNWVLAMVAAALWSTAYGWYFYPDIKHWLWRRRHRKYLAEIERAKAYAAWMRRQPPRARSSPPPQPAYTPAPAPPAASPRPRPTATLIQFPARGGSPRS
jgi:hypothetical protein